jgi:hypothetical protein
MDNETMTVQALTVEELRRQADSLIESVGAFQFTLARIAYLEGYRGRLRAILKECQTSLQASGNAGLVARIDTILAENDVDAGL